MASLRIFARSKLSSLFHAHHRNECQRILTPASHEVQKRWAHFLKSQMYTDPSKYTDFEISSNPEEWKYVERLLPYKIVPEVLSAENTPSGWKPQNVIDKNLPYFIPRSKNHMQPVYLQLSKRNMRKLTYIRKIQGDIWKLESELKEYLQAKKYRSIGTRINELAGVVIFHGDHVSVIKEWLDTKGL